MNVLLLTLAKSRSCEIGCYNDRIATKFDSHLGSAAADVSVWFQSDWKSLNPNLAASILHPSVDRCPGLLSEIWFLGQIFFASTLMIFPFFKLCACICSSPHITLQILRTYSRNIFHSVGNISAILSRTNSYETTEDHNQFVRVIINKMGVNSCGFKGLEWVGKCNHNR